MENTLTPPKMSAEKDPLLSEAIMNYMHCTCGPCMVDMEGHLRQLVEADRKELLSLVQVLVDKGNAVVERWESPLWKDVPHTGTFINDLRTAVEAVAKYGITPTPK